jgi:cytochrome c-type biogenesis protein CcmH/NrfF
MSREGVVMVFGILTAVSPFLGLPYTWLMWMLPILGLVSFGLALSLRVKRQRARTVPNAPVTPIEHESRVV